MPINLVLRKPDTTEISRDYTEYVRELQGYIDQVHTFARKHFKVESDRQKRCYDHGAQTRRFSRGNVVWLYNPQRKKVKSPKLHRPWQGLCLVVDRLDDLVYRIQKGKKSKPRVVHADRLKRYQGDNAPNWLDNNSLVASPDQHTSGSGDEGETGDCPVISTSRQRLLPLPEPTGRAQPDETDPGPRRSRRTAKPPYCMTDYDT